MAQNYWLFGTHLTILVDEQKSNGNYDLIEGTLAEGVETPLHLHSKYSEKIYVLEGEFTIYTPGKTITAKPGESFFIPENTPHVVAAGNSRKNRALTVASPSGFAKLIRNAGTLDNGSGILFEDPNTMERFMEFSEVIGDILLKPPGGRP
jgi:quercetin dioxygenase-like cupin family protein